MQTRSTWPFALAGLALIAGLAHAVAHAWVCDDAFISFRYVLNFVNGDGLVFNRGEQVEGYTNFLWVVLLAIGRQCGLDVLLGSQYLGVAFFVATILLLARVAQRSSTIPIAAIAVALHGHLSLFSTCGLETLMFTFLVTAALVLLMFAERDRSIGLAGLLLILATMTRPDGAVFYMSAGCFVLGLSRQARSFRPALAFALPFVLVYLPYFFWKLSYYGYPFPNTFYAKSASEPFVDQGLYYIGLYLACYWYLVPALVAPLLFLLRRKESVPWPRPWSRRGDVLLVLFTLPFLAYVAWVGGDFMFSRFCLPVTPALCLALQRIAPRSLALALGVVAASCLTWFVVYPQWIKPQLRPGNPRNVVAENDHYPKWYVDAYRILGRQLASIQPEFRVAVGGGQAMLGVFGGFPYVLEIHGLTDEFIAHRTIEERGRVGHEKSLPMDHSYYREKKIHLMAGMYQQVVIPGDRLATQRKFEFFTRDVPFFGEVKSDWAQATLLIYDAEVMKPLIGMPGVRFQPFPEFLDGYITTMGQRGREEVGRDLPAFQSFYFDHNDDPARLSKIRAFVGKTP